MVRDAWESNSSSSDYNRGFFLFSCFTLHVSTCRHSCALSGFTLTAVVFVLYFNPPVFFVFLRAHDKTKQKKNRQLLIIFSFDMSADGSCSYYRIKILDL